MDRRIQKTRRAIFDAFDSLIVKNDYSKISVQNIIDVANIGRSTFYEHFETKDDLLQAKCTELFEHIFSPDSSEKTHAFPSNSSLEDKLSHILFHLMDDKRVVKGILSSEGEEIFLRFFRNYMTDVVRTVELKTSTVPTEYLTNHMVASFVETVKWWVKRDFWETPELLTKYYSEVVSPLLKL